MKPFEPIHIDTTEAEEVKRVPFFYIDDEEYTIPEEVPASIVMRYFRDVDEKGPEVAVARAMIELIGEDAMDALAESPSVTDEQTKQIMAVVEELLMGAMKKASGKSRSERRRSRG